MLEGQIFHLMSKKKWQVLETNLCEAKQTKGWNSEGFKGDIYDHVKISFVVEAQVSVTCKTIYFI